jgi:type II secretory pathway pseudopilin PulG
MKRMRLGFRGDSIVEVLICLTILGLTMGSATVVVNNNRKTILGTQEQSVALKLVQAQIEKSRIVVANDPTLLTAGTSVMRSSAGYCVTTATEVVIASDADCKVDRGGNPSTEEPRYTLNAIITSDQGGYLLRTTAVWAAPTGSNGNVELRQRIYP